MKEAADMVDKRMSLFVRNVLRGVLAFALLGGVLSVRATDDIAGRPNFLEGGRTYYYPTAQGLAFDITGANVVYGTGGGGGGAAYHGGGRFGGRGGCGTVILQLRVLSLNE